VTPKKGYAPKPSPLRERATIGEQRHGQPVAKVRSAASDALKEILT
jgi:hypothetical protein